MTESPQMPPHLTVLRCLFLMAHHHGLGLDPELFGAIPPTDPLNSVLRVMNQIGLHGRALTGRTWSHLSQLGTALPALVIMKDGAWGVMINIITNPDKSQSVALVDPRTEQSGIQLLPQEAFLAQWSGTVILVRRRFGLQSDGTSRFGLSWFLPEIMRQRRYFRDIAIASILANLIAFATPLLFQVMIDKVIGHRSYQTLTAVIAIFVVLTLFDGVFGYIRQYLTIFATCKINASLSSKTFQHLLRLPMSFFESTPTGVLARNMQQTEGIRNFLTGRLFHTLLDTVALPFLLVMLSMYSGKLTMVVLCFSLAIALVIGLMIPLFRRKLEQLYNAEGHRQAHLIETIHGMRTFKSLALEGMRQQGWDEKLAKSVRSQAVVGGLAAWASVLTHGIEKSMQMAILGLGAFDVFDGTMSLGALIAFNMVAGRVSGPLVQIVSLINEYQETSLAVQMLGQVMDHPQERASDHSALRPPITGNVDFDQVTFSYPGAVNPALNQLSFSVKEGQVIGVVGRSGSGKTTITRLIQAIHLPQHGLIRLNGVDIRHIDLAYLRRNIGVVLQDSFLFRGTIRDNIAAARPEASLAEVINAAQMAGAAEFIDSLPQSYDTLVEEGATNFSGGQRQRLAIARALLTKPRLLIFDEATSALDPDSEMIIQNNLAEIAKGRTMIIVSHRLSSLVMADAILVLEKGVLVDCAPHAVLLERCAIYRHLWQQQTRHIQ